MSAALDEPAIPRRVQRPLAAVWISLGLHAAVIALVQVAPPAAVGMDGPVIEARLVLPHAEVSAAETPDDASDATPLLAPSESAEALPVPQTATPPQPTPPAGAAQTTAAAPAMPQLVPTPAPALAIGSAVDLTYYSAREIDVLPRAVREIVPDYPADAGRQRVSGRVSLRLKIEADGRVSDIEVVSSDSPGVFEDAVVKAFRDARFTPALKDGRPVRALVLVPVKYEWEGPSLTRPPAP